MTRRRLSVIHRMGSCCIIYVYLVDVFVDHGVHDCDSANGIKKLFDFVCVFFVCFFVDQFHQFNSTNDTCHSFILFI